MKKTEKRGLAPRSLVEDAGRRSALASLDRPSASAATAFVRAALDAPAAPAVAPVAASPGTQAPGERSLRRVALHEIDLEKRRFQYRVSRNLAKLQDSLLLQGQQVPVILRGKEAPYEIVSGFGRCDALALALKQGRAKDVLVWADVRSELLDREAHEISVLENEDREGLSELDRVNKAKKLKSEGYVVSAIASVLKKGERMVQYYLSLADAPLKVATALTLGTLRPTHALVLTKFSREALAELSAEEVEARLDDLLERCQKGASVAELRAALAPERGPSVPKLLVARGQGFEVRGFQFRPDMPERARRELLSVLEEARALVQASLA
jgi:ParB/RepB/Spo0J family partition protein